MKNSLLIVLIIPFIFISCDGKKTEMAKKENKVVNKSKRALDACSLIDKSEIEKILNTKMKEPKPGKSQDGGKSDISFSECSYQSNDGSHIFLSIYVRFSPFKEDALATIQNVRNSFKQSGIQVYNVEGIGDVAFWGGSQLHVFLDDNYYIIITLIGLKDRDDAINKSKIIAQKIAESIK